MKKTMLTLLSLIALLAIATGAFADEATDAKMKAMEKRLQKMETKQAKDRIQWTGDLRVEAHSSTGEVGCACVGELGQDLGIVASTISHHIKELRQAGLIRMERRGQKMECWIDPETLSALRDFF